MSVLNFLLWSVAILCVLFVFAGTLFAFWDAVLQRRAASASMLDLSDLFREKDARDADSD